MGGGATIFKIENFLLSSENCKLNSNFWVFFSINRVDGVDDFKTKSQGKIDFY